MIRFSQFLRTTLPVGLILVLATPGFAGNDDRHRGKKHKSYKYGSRYGGGYSRVELTPNGISYGYDSGNFGIQIGPFLGDHFPVYDRGRYFRNQIVDSHIEPEYYAPTYPLTEETGQLDSYQAPIAPNQRVLDYGPPIAPIPADERDVEPESGTSYRTLIPTNRDAELYQRDAEGAFLDGRFDLAEKFAKHSILEDPGNGKLYLFAAQSQFAIGDYSGSLKSIERATVLLNQAEWGFVIQNFQQLYTGDAYVKQMDSLNRFLIENPMAADAMTLRGYHFQFLGYEEASRKDYNRSLALKADSPLTKKLRAILSEEIPLPKPALKEPPQKSVIKL